MDGFASAQAAYEAPPDVEDPLDCPECKGAGELCEEPLDWWHGSGVNVVCYPCRDCGGTGQIDPQDHPSWCDRCGLVGNCPDCDPPDPYDY